MSEMTMVERVARAMYERRPNGQGITGGPYVTVPWDALRVDERAEHLANARVAMLAMREPTKSMMDATHYDIPIADDFVWRAMIDAALAPPPPAAPAAGGEGWLSE